MATATAWKNRIVGEGLEAPDQLLAHDKNWRIHPKHQQDALEAAPTLTLQTVSHGL